MRIPNEVVQELRVHPGRRAGLASRSTSATDASWVGPSVGGEKPREVAERELDEFKVELSRVQELLYASDTWSLLVIFQALDAAGKDGTIKHVMSGVNPQGCAVYSFKPPSAEEQRHDFLWRSTRVLPETGRIGIFNRSYYEEVLVVRVHPELIRDEHLPPETTAGAALWHRRFDDINSFEHHMVRNGTRIVKFFLHVSKEEQRRRLLERLDNPAKHWKFSAADIAERAFFDAYQEAYEEAITATSTSWAPWYVIPADNKAAMRALVGGIIVEVVEGLDLHYPELGPEDKASLESARQALLAEQ